MVLKKQMKHAFKEYENVSTKEKGKRQFMKSC